MTIPAECQKVILGIVPTLGARTDVMNLQIPVAAAELAGELITLEDLDHNFFPAPSPPHRVRALVIPAVLHT
jgi:hypothetical protein